jgi:hypothetical protein
MAKGDGFVKNAAAVLGLATAAVGILFALDPSLRPDPRTRVAAALEAPALDNGVTTWAYLRRLGYGGAWAKNDCAPGTVTYVQESIEGFKDRHTILHYVTYDAATGRRPRGTYQRYTNSEFAHPLPISSGAPSDQSVSVSWVQWPYLDGRFFIRFELFHGSTFLALVDTKPFAVTRKRWGQIYASCLAARSRHQLVEAAGPPEGSLGGGSGGSGLTRWAIAAALLGATGVAGFALGRRLRRPPAEAAAGAGVPPMP